MGLFSGKERDEAKKLGLAVTEVEREIPEFPGDGTVKLEVDRCARYSLPRRFKGGPAWSLLQRTKAF